MRFPEIKDQPPRKPGRPLALLVVILVLPSLHGRQVNPGNPDRKCSVAGKVTSTIGGEPLRKAYVRLVQKSGNRAETYAVVTGPDGCFLFADVEPGTYVLRAEKQGYLESELGAAGAPRTVIDRVELRLSAGQKLENVEVQLAPQAAISGRVVDQDGDPWEHASVSAFRCVWRKGKRQLQGIGRSGMVDDRGGFRIGELPPGRYFLRADPDERWWGTDLPAPDKQPTMRVQAAWYPSALDADAAIPVVVRAGQEVEGAEIRLRAARAYRIKGKVIGLSALPATRPAPSWAGPRLWASRLSSYSRSSGPSYRGTLQPSGAFEIEGVAPGTYEINVYQTDTGRGLTLGRTIVEVAGKDLEDVVVQTAPPFKLTGRIRIEGEQPGKRLVSSVALDAVNALTWFRPAPIQEDGSFEFEEVAAELYEVRVHTTEENVYLEAIRLGDNESRNGLVDLSRPGDAPLELILSRKGAQIRGMLKPDEAESGPGSSASRAVTPPRSRQIWLIPDSADLTVRESRARAAQLDQYGTFAIKGIPPGDYILYAWQDLPEDAWRHPEFLDKMKSRGLAVTLREGEAKQVELSVISPTETAELLAKLGIE